MVWVQWTVLALHVFTLFSEINKVGKPKKPSSAVYGPQDIWITLGSAALFWLSGGFSHIVEWPR